MHLETLWLQDFRSYTEAHFEPSPIGITVVTGINGAGKTNLIEAIGYLATLKSLRGTPTEAMVRVPNPAEDPPQRAVVRAQAYREARRLTVEAELNLFGRDRVQINGQPLRRTRDLLGAIQVTVFSPDDLVLVKGPPQGRRDYLDDLLVALHPRHDLLVSEVERVLKQRNALLKSAGGSRHAAAGRSERSLPDDIRITLDVWDTKLSVAGTELVEARCSLVAELEPLVGESYNSVAADSVIPRRASTSLSYKASWSGDLGEALAGAREDDLRRGVTTVGPHRDDFEVAVSGMSARTHASQGEQRCVALALKLAGHRLVTSRIGTPPILLLDDVFSELDPSRSAALLQNLPAGQSILTTAGVVPEVAVIEARFGVDSGQNIDVTTWRPTSKPASERDPCKVSDPLDRLTRRLGVPASGLLALVFSRWEELVGVDIAAHCRPVSLRSGVLSLAVEQTAWATQLKYMVSDMLERIAEATGSNEITEIQIRVQPVSEAASKPRRPRQETRRNPL